MTDEMCATIKKAMLIQKQLIDGQNEEIDLLKARIKILEEMLKTFGVDVNNIKEGE